MNLKRTLVSEPGAVLKVYRYEWPPGLQAKISHALKHGPKCLRIPMRKDGK